MRTYIAACGLVRVGDAVLFVRARDSATSLTLRRQTRSALEVTADPATGDDRRRRGVHTLLILDDEKLIWLVSRRRATVDELVARA